MEVESIIGLKFGRLTVIKEDGNFYHKVTGEKRHKKYLCKCDCGNEFYATAFKLRNGDRKSCGCITRKHGLSKTQDYNIWNLMIQRCYNEKTDRYPNYGGKGIRVCPEWLDDMTGFIQFSQDMGLRPTLNHTIERVDVSKDYCPENCIWTDDMSLQGFNQTTRKSNTSGRTGVSYCEEHKKSPWTASISKAGKVLRKTFQTFEEAVSQREEWELELYGFIKVH